MDERDFKQALDAAKKGDSYQQVRVGDYYRDEEDWENAFSWYLMASEQGNPKGQVQLGEFFETGMGVEENEEEAFKWYMKAANQNDPVGQVRVGDCYEDGVGVEIDEEEAFKWFSKAAEQDNLEGMFDVGRCYMEGIGVEENAVKAFEVIMKTAYRGYAPGQKLFGDFHLEGNYLERNEAEAFGWYKKAAKQEFAAAQDEVGVCYLNGTGVEKDENEAFYWFSKAADNYSLFGMIHAGNCYRDGIGVEKDEEKAFEQYVKAANFLSPWAMIQVGDCYHNGIGVDADSDEAFNWYLKAANQENAVGQSRVGDCLMEGIGIHKDEELANEFYLKAAEQGYSYAQRMVGECLFCGSGKEKNESEAVKWFEKAAEQGDENAQIELGNCLLDGIGVDRNEAKAVEWFEKAAEQGSFEAIDVLMKCHTERLLEIDFQKILRILFEFAKRGDIRHQEMIAMLFACKNDPILLLRKRQGDAEASCLYSLASQLKESDSQMVFEWIEQAALQGDSVAQELINIFYAEGICVEKNERKAIEGEILLGEQGDLESLVVVGCRYLSGGGIEKNERKAYEWFKKAADQGNVEGKALVALCYYTAAGVEKDIDKAAKLVLETADDECFIGLLLAAFIFIDESNVQDFEKALSFLRKLIKVTKDDNVLSNYFCSSLFFVACCGRKSEKTRLTAKEILEEFDSDTVQSIDLFKQLLNADFSSKDDCRNLVELCYRHRDDSCGCAYILLTVFSLSTSNRTEIFDSILDKNDLKSYAYYRKALQCGFPFQWFDDCFPVDKNEVLNYELTEARFDLVERINPLKIEKALSDCFKHLSSSFNIPINDFCNRILGDKAADEYVLRYFKNWDPEKNTNFMGNIKTSLSIAGIKRKPSNRHDNYDSLSLEWDKEKNYVLKTLKAEGIKLETLTAEQLKEYIKLYLPSLGNNAREEVYNKIVFPTTRFNVIENDEGEKEETEGNIADDKKTEEMVFDKIGYLQNIKELIRELEKSQYVKKWVKRDPAIGTCILASILYESISPVFQLEDIIQVLGNSEYFKYDVRPLLKLFEENGKKVAPAREICVLIGKTEENYSRSKQVFYECFVDAYDKVFGKNYSLEESKKNK